MNSKKLTPKHIIIKVSKAKDSLEGSWREANHHIQGILSKIISKFLIRNLAGQTSVAPYFDSDERKQYNHEYFTRQAYHTELKEK